MSAREDILAAIRAKRPPGVHELPQVPVFNIPAPEGNLALFKKSLLAMGGRVLEPAPGQDVPAALRDHLASAKNICSAAPEVAGNRDLASVSQPKELADVDVAVARAVLGVAETGSVLFTEAELVVNTLAYLAQHLVVLLDPKDIVPGLQAAYARSEFHQAHYAVFHTGPSATGDIEGVLIHGAQGVRSLTVVFLPRA